MARLTPLSIRRPSRTGADGAKALARQETAKIPMLSSKKRTRPWRSASRPTGRRMAPDTRIIDIDSQLIMTADALKSSPIDRRATLTDEDMNVTRKPPKVATKRIVVRSRARV